MTADPTAVRELIARYSAMETFEGNGRKVFDSSAGDVNLMLIKAQAYQSMRRGRGKELELVDLERACEELATGRRQAVQIPFGSPAQPYPAAPDTADEPAPSPAREPRPADEPSPAAAAEAADGGELRLERQQDRELEAELAQQRERIAELEQEREEQLQQLAELQETLHTEREAHITREQQLTQELGQVQQQHRAAAAERDRLRSRMRWLSLKLEKVKAIGKSVLMTAIVYALFRAAPYIISAVAVAVSVLGWPVALAVLAVGLVVIAIIAYRKYRQLKEIVEKAVDFLKRLWGFGGWSAVLASLVTLALIFDFFNFAGPNCAVLRFSTELALSVIGVLTAAYCEETTTTDTATNGDRGPDPAAHQHAD